MARVKPAYRMISDLRDALDGFEADARFPPTEADLAIAQIEATLAVAQATAEMASSVDDLGDVLKVKL